MIVDRRLLVAYAVLTFWAMLFLALPGVAMLFAILTLGAALLVPSLWLYTTALIPAYALWCAGATKLVAVPIGIVSVALLVVVPGQIARPALQKMIADYTATDFRGDLPMRPASIEFVRRSTSYSSADDNPLKHAVCDEVCQRLLLTRQVQSVTTRAIVAKARSVVVTYTIVEQQRCPVAFAESRYVLPSTIRANIAGVCIVPKIGIALASGLSIRVEELKRNTIPAFSLVSIERARRVTVAMTRDGRQVPLRQMTEVSVGAAATPFMITTYAGLLTTVKGVAIAKTRTTTNRYDLLAFMSDELGLAVVPDNARGRFDRSPADIIRKAESPLDVDQEMVRAILAKPGSEPFGPEVVDAIGRWAWKYPTDKAGPAETAKPLLAEILLDPRISPPNDVISVVFRNNRKLIPMFAEQMLARLTWPEAKSAGNGDRNFAMLISHQPDEQLALHRDLILNALRAGLSQNRSPLLIAAGRLGLEGLPFLLQGLDSHDDQIFRDAIRASCGAMPVLAPGLSPVLEALLSDKRRDTEKFNVIRAIASLSGIATAEQAISRQPSGRQEPLRAFLERAAYKDGVVRCPDH